MKTIILIKGKKRAGKDTVAGMMHRLLNDNYSVARLSFAEPMKEILADTFDISLDYLDISKNDIIGHEIIYGDVWNSTKLTDFRKLLQRFGTEAMKKQFGDDVWVELAYSKIHSDITIISDWRFKSEFEYLSKQKDTKIITVDVRRVGLVSGDTHISEIDLDDVECDYTLYNEDYNLEDLEVQIATMLQDLPKQSIMKYFDYFKCGARC